MRKLRGFTLIELIVVVSVIAVLAGIITPAVGNIIDDARDSKMVAEVKNLATACLQYEKQYGYLPYSGLPGGSANYSYAYSQANTNQLHNLIRSYVGRMIVTDPWGQPYMYHQYYAYNPPARAICASFGKDRANQGEWNSTYWSYRYNIPQTASAGGYYFVWK